ncbi:putative metallophosphoesterase YhaO [Andreprevotia sp. IGB-42]|uniref:metallophosphoesterase family protein n=1 Tax=Andreprevotia sp. IGB-42 TaxID=2497473 RepID=UPI001356F82C|nr:DNA repair exonuclease [Andreprevotia sp. IGB-42]KAF0813917.1 putative metallophosphoesterase YhaO [Andreprevotia sp. IGB-42]
MKFIHAADIHLDSPLNGLSAYPDAPAEQLRSATRDAFTLLVDRAIAEQVDFMVIAGDLYDGAWRDFNTGIYFAKQMGRLKRVGIHIYVVFGNHDAESEMTKKLELPDNVHAFSPNKPQTFRVDGLDVSLHGQSFKQRDVTTNLVTGYPAPTAGHFNIGVLHTALEGYQAHSYYAPCTVAELHAKGYDYWALGHVHEFQQWAGASTIVFPGNLQGRNVRELGRRGAVMVTVDEAGTVAVERIFIDVLRWEHLIVDASDCETLEDVVRKTGYQLESLLGTDGEIPRAARITIRERTKAHGALFGLELQLRQEVLAQIAAIGNERLWLEKIQIATKPMEDAAKLHERMDAFTDLQTIFEEASTDLEFIKELKDALAPFVGKAPFDLQPLVPLIEKIRTGDLKELIDDIAPGLLAHLAQAE